MASGACSPKACSTASASSPRTARGSSVVAGQKAELTRISDTNGDGIADQYDTLFDAHSYHGNYHTYMHGPVRAPDGSYYFALNLVHDGSGTAYTAGGNIMGTWGGFNGWAIRVKPDWQVRVVREWPAQPGEPGRRAPTGASGTRTTRAISSRRRRCTCCKKDAFYGHPAGLVDLPGMTPDVAGDPVGASGRIATRATRHPVPAQPRREFARQSGLGDQRQVRPVRGADADRRPDAVEPAARRRCRKSATSSRAASCRSSKDSNRA